MEALATRGSAVWEPGIGLVRPGSSQAAARKEDGIRHKYQLYCALPEPASVNLRVWRRCPAGGGFSPTKAEVRRPLDIPPPASPAAMPGGDRHAKGDGSHRPTAGPSGR